MEVKTDRRIAKTREAIFQAFISLIGEKNFESITINEIADRANVNRGTIYFHYSDKYDLLDKCMEEYLSKMSTVSTATGQDGETVDLLESSLMPIIRYFQEHHTFYLSMLSNQGIPSFRKRMLEIVTDSIATHVNMEDQNQGYNKELITQFMASAFVGVIEWWILSEMAQPPEEISTQLWGLLKRNQVIH